MDKMFTKITDPSIGWAHYMRYAAAWLRTRAYEGFVLLVSIIAGAPIIFYLQWTHKPLLVRRLLRFWSSGYIYGARYILGVKYKLEGLENIPSGQVIYMGNHQTAWESIMMTVLVPHVNMVTKLKAISIPVFGWGLKHAPMIVIDPDARGLNLRRLLKDGKASIKAGRSIVIFPEGARVPIGETQPYARGYEILYKHCKVPVIPFVTDAGLHWPSGFSTKYPATITLRFLPAIEAGKNPEVFATELEDTIRSEAAQLMLQ
jgi:1-acyl-sn-glycerol-3-phosphate acyltransferase